MGDFIALLNQQVLNQQVLTTLVNLGYKGGFWSRWRDREQIMPHGPTADLDSVLG
ncbi:hypothetical protein ACTG9Q_15905 [Actinokineospora sp. 24-640]